MLNIFPHDQTEDSLFRCLLDILSGYGYAESDVKSIELAYCVAKKHHQHQNRKSGEPYIVHPLSVAVILAHLRSDSLTVCAGLLHDVLEDTTVTESEIQDNFGEVVLQLVRGVTKLGKINLVSQKEQQAENLRKLVLSVAQDVRILLVKLADRLHNMMTLEHLSDDKQKRIAIETLDIFAPLANRFGLNYFKWRLEDLAFKHLEPTSYRKIESMVMGNRKTRESYLNKIKLSIQNEIESIGVSAEVKGRVKHFYSIYNKIQRLNTDELFDLLAIRIVVSDITQCYSVLGILHGLFQPIPGRFKDYIATPKSNGYKSLHTSVIGPDKRIIELQIRTVQMHEIAEFGVAAHWKYKESGSISSSSNNDNNYSKLQKRLLEMEKEIPDVDEYNEAVKLDLFTDEIFVFSPKGDVFPLPRGSSPVDFAYHIHTEIGNKCTGAKINERIVSLSSELKNGDIIEILTSKNAQPSTHWLTFVKSRSTRSRIKQWFRKNKRTKYIDIGMSTLQELLGKSQYNDLSKEEAFTTIAEALGWDSEDELFLRVGLGEVSHNQFLGRLKNAGFLQSKDNPPTSSRQPKSQSSTNQIQSLKNLLHSFAKCCQPIPGETIIGTVSRGKGIKIHRDNCPNILGIEEDRLLEVAWDESSTKEKFKTNIEIECMDRVGISRDILDKIAKYNVNVYDIRSTSSSKTLSLIRLSIEVHSVSVLQKIMTDLETLTDVVQVRRQIVRSQRSTGNAS